MSRDVYKPQAYLIFLVPATLIFFVAHLFVPWWAALLITTFGYVAIAYILVIIGAAAGAVL